MLLLHLRGTNSPSKGGYGGVVVYGVRIQAAHHLKAEQHTDHCGAHQPGRPVQIIVGGPLANGGVDTGPGRFVAPTELRTGTLVARCEGRFEAAVFQPAGVVDVTMPV